MNQEPYKQIEELNHKMAQLGVPFEQFRQALVRVGNAFAELGNVIDAKDANLLLFIQKLKREEEIRAGWNAFAILFIFMLFLSIIATHLYS